MCTAAIRMLNGAEIATVTYSPENCNFQIKDLIQKIKDSTLLTLDQRNGDIRVYGGTATYSDGTVSKGTVNNDTISYPSNPTSLRFHALFFPCRE